MSFELQPTLTGPLVSLRPLGNDDFDALYAVASDPLIWEQHPDSERYQLDVFRQFFADAMASGGALVICDASTGAIIGSSRYHGYNEAASEIEIGWTFLSRAYWGGATNKVVKQLMLAHALQYVDAVIFLVGPDNYRSRRAMEKIGGVQIEDRADATGRISVAYRMTALELQVLSAADG